MLLYYLYAYINMGKLSYKTVPQHTMSDALLTHMQIFSLHDLYSQQWVLSLITKFS